MFAQATPRPPPRPRRSTTSYIVYDSMDLDPTDEQRSIIDVFGALADRTCPVDQLREHEPLGFSPHSGSSSSPSARRAWPCRRTSAVRAPTCSTCRSRSKRSVAGSPRRRSSSTRSPLGCSPTPTRCPTRSSTAPGSRRSRCGPPATTWPRLVPAGAVADVVVALDGDDLVVVTSPPGDLVPNLASAPLADRPVDADAVEAAHRARRPAPKRASSTRTRSTSGECSPPPRSPAWGWARWRSRLRT